MSLENKLKAVAKNIEGKIQEAVGEVTGDPEAKAKGKAKQVQASVIHAVENAKAKIEEVKAKVNKSLDE